MVNEAVKVELTNSTGNVRRFAVSDSTGIAKGALLELQDPRTAILVTGANKPIAGIAAEEKVANDGATSIAVYTDGIFELKASGAISVGMSVVSDAAIGQIKAAGAYETTASGAITMGYALETAADAEVINVRISL
jgi:hypothetical protein